MRSIKSSFVAFLLVGLSQSTEMTGSSTSASYGSATTTASYPSGGQKVHVIQVGSADGSLIFSPNNIQAAVGDSVQFQFWPKNHSVVQSTFDNPCVPIQNVKPEITSAFFSGFMPVDSAPGNTLAYTIPVLTTDPIWFYCSQSTHCQSGMVGAINAAPSGDKTIEAFIALAAKAPENLSPGQQPGSGYSASASLPTASSMTPLETSTTLLETSTTSFAAGSTGGFVGNSSGSTLSTTASLAGSGTSPGVAQQTTNAASSRLADIAWQSVFGITYAGLAALFFL